MEFVSCIMPTRSERREFIPKAVECFLAQTWKEKELVVVDDGPEPVFELFASVPNLVYVRMPGKMTVGRKRNIANEHAAGEIILHWDDDDWSASNRIEKQVFMLRDGKSVAGFSDMLFWDGKSASEYKGAAKYACGTSLAYRKAYWQGHMFPDVVKGEDNHMVYRAASDIVTESGRGMIVASIHPGNTSPKDSGSFDAIKVSELPQAFLALQQQAIARKRGAGASRKAS